MTLDEFDVNFDILYSNVASNQAPGLNAYEKSFFLTKAQEEVVLSLYSGKNVGGESFERTEELRRYLSNLVKEIELEELDATLNPVTTTNGKPLGVDSHSRFFTLPDNLWFITYEEITVQKEGCPEGKTTIEVVPVRQDEYNKLRKNPFRGANSRRALRLDLADGVVEIVCKYTTIESYYVRYLRRLNPIILEELPEGLEIGGNAGPKECELDEALHQKILEAAVLMAWQAMAGSVGASTRSS